MDQSYLKLDSVKQNEIKKKVETFVSVVGKFNKPNEFIEIEDLMKKVFL